VQSLGCRVQGIRVEGAPGLRQPPRVLDGIMVMVLELGFRVSISRSRLHFVCLELIDWLLGCLVALLLDWSMD